MSHVRTRAEHVEWTRWLVVVVSSALMLLVASTSLEARGTDGIVQADVSSYTPYGGPAHESFPRIANIYFPSLADADLEALARWDVLVLAKRAEDVHRAELKTLREMNPRLQILAHMPVAYHGDWLTPPINGDMRDELHAHGWWVNDTSGGTVVLGCGSGVLNVTTWCPRDDDGKRLCDWLPEFIAERLSPGGLWDGVYLDCCWDRISWLNDYSEGPIDANGDGLADDRAALDAAWRAGMETVVSRLRELVGEDYIIATNGNNTHYEQCNGSTRENFPNMHGDWYDNITDPEHGYVAIDAKYRRPSVNIINVMWSGPVDENGLVRDAAFERWFGFTLASTLVYGDGYFSFDGGAGLRHHSQAWWHELYEMDLGRPVGPAEDVTAAPGSLAWIKNGDMVRARRFTNGMAVVNPSSCAQTVELGGTFHAVDGWNGRFYSHSGAVTSVCLGSYSGAVLAGTGEVLGEVEHLGHRVVGPEAVRMTWRDMPGAKAYSVYRRRDLDGDFSRSDLVAIVDDAIFVDRALRERGTYYYCVAPIDESGCEGLPSRPLAASTGTWNGVPIRLVGEEAGGRVTLSWSAPGGIALGITRTDEDGTVAEIAPFGTCEALGSGLVDTEVEAGRTYAYALVADVSGVLETVDVVHVAMPGSAPAEHRLHGCWPNPARESATISFSVGRERGVSDPPRVRVTIYDVAGRPVRRLVDELMPPGPHSVLWDGRTDAGANAAAGCYFHAVEVSEQVLTGKLILLD